MYLRPPVSNDIHALKGVPILGPEIKMGILLLVLFCK